MNLLHNVYLRGVCTPSILGYDGKGGESYAVQYEPVLPSYEQDGEINRILHGLVSSADAPESILVATRQHALIAHKEFFQDVGRGERLLRLLIYDSKNPLRVGDFMNLITYASGKNVVDKLETFPWQGCRQWPELEWLSTYPQTYDAKNWPRDWFDQLPLHQSLDEKVFWIYRAGKKKVDMKDIMSISLVLHENLRRNDKQYLALAVGRKSPDHLKKDYSGIFHYIQERELASVREWFMLEPSAEKIEDYGWEKSGEALDQRIAAWDQQEKIELDRTRGRAQKKLQRELRGRQRVWDAQPWYKKLLGPRKPTY